MVVSAVKNLVILSADAQCWLSMSSGGALPRWAAKMLSGATKPGGFCSSTRSPRKPMILCLRACGAPIVSGVKGARQCTTSSVVDFSRRHQKATTSGCETTSARIVAVACPNSVQARLNSNAMVLEGSSTLCCRAPATVPGAFVGCAVRPTLEGGVATLGWAV
jgi:hypothetical protein